MRRSRCQRKNKQQGGGQGAGWTFSPSSFDKVINNSVIATPSGNCRTPDTPRPGFIPGGFDALKGTYGALPGMRGGRRKHRKGKTTRKHRSRKSKHTRKHTRKVMRGGRYGFDPSIATEIGGAPWGSSYAPISRIDCEASRTAVPPSGASDNLNSRSSYLWTAKGGAATTSVGLPVSAPGTLIGSADKLVTWPNHGAASGSPSEMVPTARYSDNLDGAGISTAAGTKLMIHSPLGYGTMNPACLKTGGGKKTRKHKKGSRKH